MVWIFLTSFFLLSSKFSLGKSDLAKILISFEKILLIENSQIAIVVTSEITSHVHAGFQFIFSPSLEKQELSCCPGQPGLTWLRGKVTCGAARLKEDSQLGCLFFSLLWQQQVEWRGYYKIFLP